jgi:toxin ParE1/3/4
VTASAILTGPARRELRAAIAWIAADNPDAAERLNDVIRDAARLIGANPAIGRRRPALAGARYRFWSVPRFPYLLAYTDVTAPPRILRIVHTARDLPRILADLLD